MVPVKLLHFRSTVSLLRGLRELERERYGPGNILFLALDSGGNSQLAVTRALGKGSRLKVGKKLALPWPFEGRCFYFDAFHPLGRRTAVVNGDRRLRQVSSLLDISALVSGFIEHTGEQSMFFGCTPHQPGSWWVHESETVALHERGYVEIVPTPRGLVARRTVDDGLYFLPAAAASLGELDRWQRVFDSRWGNILMLERRMLEGRLVLSCQRGLVELDLRALPQVTTRTVVELDAGYAVVGRITGGAFAVTRGIPQDWGLDELQPAVLLGARGGTVAQLGRLLEAEAAAEGESDV